MYDRNESKEKKKGEQEIEIEVVTAEEFMAFSSDKLTCSRTIWVRLYESYFCNDFW